VDRTNVVFCSSFYSKVKLNLRRHQQMYPPYFVEPDLFKSHMISSPLRALVRILLLKAEAHDELRSNETIDTRTPMTPRDVRACTIYFESTAFPKVARRVYAMTPSPNRRFVFWTMRLRRVGQTHDPEGCTASTGDIYIVFQEIQTFFSCNSTSDAVSTLCDGTSTAGRRSWETYIAGGALVSMVPRIRVQIQSRG